MTIGVNALGVSESKSYFWQMRLLLLWALVVVWMTACNSKGEDTEERDSPSGIQTLSEGVWRFSMQITEDRVLPFNLHLANTENGYVAVFRNAEETLPSEKVEIEGDSLSISLPIFRSVLRTKIHSEDSVTGVWVNLAKGTDYKIPLTGVHGYSRRFNDKSCDQPPNSYDGKYEVTFSPGTEDAYKAIGIFHQIGDSVTGTFVTETGDYRFLEGNVDCGELRLSCFDGSHAFLFEARSSGDSIVGDFYSGKHWHEPWVAVLSDSFKLRHPDSLTYLNPGYETISFSFPDLDSNIVTYPSDSFENKVVVIQLIGSWCPNCMDETKMYSEFYNKYHERGLEMISLGFEAQRDFKTASASLKRLKNYFNAPYPFLVAGYASKKEAGNALPMLNHVMSFPTCIFIDRSGRVRRISTGFYGPGTGDYYVRYKERIEQFLQKLLSE